MCSVCVGLHLLCCAGVCAAWCVVQEVKYNRRCMLGVYFLELLGRIQYAGHM